MSALWSMTQPLSLATGYYGIPGSSRGNFTVHIVDAQKPLCGWHPRKDMQFQWCGWGIVWDFVECSSCKRAAKLAAKRASEAA